MYFPIGWPRELRFQDDGSPLVAISANIDRLLFAVLSQSTLSIWYCQVRVIISSKTTYLRTSHIDCYFSLQSRLSVFGDRKILSVSLANVLLLSGNRILV